MRIEHKLSPAQTAFCRKAAGEIRAARKMELEALGTAREAAEAGARWQAALGQNLELIVINEQLPQAPEGYSLSPDGSALVGEVPEQAPRAAPPMPSIAAMPQAAASEPAPEAPLLSSKRSEINRAFADLSNRIGRARYFEELARAGVDTPIRLGSIERIREFYRQLWNIAEVA